MVIKPPTDIEGKCMLCDDTGWNPLFDKPCACTQSDDEEDDNER